MFILWANKTNSKRKIARLPLCASLMLLAVHCQNGRGNSANPAQQGDFQQVFRFWYFYRCIDHGRAQEKMNRCELEGEVLGGSWLSWCWDENKAACKPVSLPRVGWCLRTSSWLSLIWNQDETGTVLVNWEWSILLTITQCAYKTQGLSMCQAYLLIHLKGYFLWGNGIVDG